MSLFASGAIADVPPDVMIRQTTEKVLTRLHQAMHGASEHAASKTEKKKGIASSEAFIIAREVLAPHVDQHGIAKLVAGRSLWHQLTKTERAFFTEQLMQMVLRTYSTALSQYSDEKIEVYSVRNLDKNAKRAEVKSLIVRKLHDNIPVSYRVRRVDDVWMIYDVRVAGVSLLHSFRTQLKELLANHPFSQVMEILKRNNMADASQGSR